MTQETENFLSRREQFLNLATEITMKHAPLLSKVQAREVAKISLLSWQDMRDCHSYTESSDYLLTL